METTSKRHDRALVLNAGWQPIGTVSWQNAFRLILSGRAKPINYYDDIVQTPNDEYFVPAVIVLVGYNSVPKRRLLFCKRLVYERDNYTCQYCGEELTQAKCTVDHVVPRSKGGPSTFENCVTACFQCNTQKANKNLCDTKFKLKNNPRKPFLHPLHGRISKINPEWKEFIDGSVI